VARVARTSRADIDLFRLIPRSAYAAQTSLRSLHKIAWLCGAPHHEVQETRSLVDQIDGNALSRAAVQYERTPP
jgi:hypothetical protein